MVLRFAPGYTSFAPNGLHLPRSHRPLGLATERAKDIDMPATAVIPWHRHQK